MTDQAKKRYAVPIHISQEDYRTFKAKVALNGDTAGKVLAELIKQYNQKEN